MLVSYSQKELVNILVTLERIWGKSINVIKIDIKNAPFSLMDIKVQIYKKYNILLTYDRSLLGIYIMQNEKPIYIGKFTDEEIIGDFDSCEEAILLHNFRILDDVLKALDH